MQNKKIIVVIILGVAAIFSLIYGITAPNARGRHAPSSIKPVQQVNKTGLSETASPIKRLAVRTKLKTWRRRPFAPLGQAAESPSLVLSGILSKGKIFKAMIGDAIVEKGDKVGSNTVVDIQKDKVILNDGTKDFELKLER